LFGGAQKAPAPTPPAAPSGGHSEGSGEFTRLFGGQGSSQSSTSVPRLEPKSPRNDAPAVEKGSGEFTRLFGPSGKGPGKPKAPEPERPKYKPDPMEAPLAAGDDAPGEFTRMFGSSSAAKPPGYGAPPAGRPSSASFGEGLVGDISGEEALSPNQGPKVSKNSKPFQAPGEFTRMFGPSDPSQAPPQDFIPAAQKSEGYASGLFRNPHSEPKAPAAAPPRGAVGGQAGNTPAPGAYTLMFERKGAQNAPPASATGPAPHAAATTPVPAAAKPGKGLLIGLIAAVLVAVLALGAAAYLLLNRSGDEPAENDPQAVEQPAEGSGSN
jgi:hypothetical protein